MENNNQATKDILSVGRVIIQVLKAQLNNEIYKFSADTDFKKIHKLSEIHKVTSLVAPSVIASEYAAEDIKNVFKKELFRCAARHTAQEKEAQELSELFIASGIKYCFLKGSKISKYYDNPDMRFMLDMDVFVEPEKAEDVKKILEDRGYVYDNYEDAKDAGYVKKPFLNFELHKELKYDYDKGYNYYKGAFERMVISEDGCTMNMTNEDFYVYILSHAAHHFESAGTGMKTIVDHFYLLKKLKPLCEVEVLNKALEETGLTIFNQRMDRLVQCWFSGAEPDENMKEVTDYIILSGVFGTQTNYYLSGIIRGDYTEKKSSYFLTRVFLPMKLMKKRYPILHKAPFLLPIMWVIRILSAFGNREKYSQEAKNVNSIDKSEKDKLITFLENNGL